MISIGPFKGSTELKIKKPLNIFNTELIDG
jgi:hypothetical protein